MVTGPEACWLRQMSRQRLFSLAPQRDCPHSGVFGNVQRRKVVSIGLPRKRSDQYLGTNVCRPRGRYCPKGCLLLRYLRSESQTPFDARAAPPVSPVISACMGIVERNRTIDLHLAK